MADESATIESSTTSVTEQLDALFARWNRTDEPGLVVGVAKDGRRSTGAPSAWRASSMRWPTRPQRACASARSPSTSPLCWRFCSPRRARSISTRRSAPTSRAHRTGGEPTVRQLLQHRGGSRCYLDLGFIGHGLGLPRWAGH